MTTKIKKADMERWISEAKAKHPDHPRYGPSLKNRRDAILKIAGVCYGRQVYDMLVDTGIIDKDFVPCRYFVENRLAINCHEFDTREDVTPEELKDCFELTEAGCEVLLQIVKHQLIAS